MKRSAEESAGQDDAHKKQKQDQPQYRKDSSQTHSNSQRKHLDTRGGPHSQGKHSHAHVSSPKHHHSHGRSPSHFQNKDNNDHFKPQKHSNPHEQALSQLPPPTSKSGDIPAYTHFTVSPSLPPLPPVEHGHLSTAPFTHKSTLSYNRTTSTTDLSYERLEFLGDAYIELIASRLIFERFPHLPAGQQSQLRELLVKNETLAEYSRAYGFEGRIEAVAMGRMLEEGKGKGNKGFKKVMGDVFEAYVAAVVLSDVESGFAVVEKWLTALWAPKLVEAGRGEKGFVVTHDEDADPLKIYNPEAKQELQKRILGNDVRLLYERYKDTVELKGDQLGQNRHFIALYLTGYGYDKKLLGKGEGKNKVEAGNWAATEAMHGECKGLVEECEENLRVLREQKAKEKEEKLAKKVEEKATEGVEGLASP